MPRNNVKLPFLAAFIAFKLTSKVEEIELLEDILFLRLLCNNAQTSYNSHFITSLETKIARFHNVEENTAKFCVVCGLEKSAILSCGTSTL